MTDRIPDHAQSAGYGETTEEFSLYRHLYRQREWSSQMFGPGSRTQGIIDHIRKELGEIEAVPADVTEWIDVVILALDGAWRTGATPGQIIAALVAKQTKNEGRVWPDWRTADPNKAIEHVKASELTEGDDAWRPIATAPKDQEVEVRGIWKLRGDGVEFTHWRPSLSSTNRGSAT